MRFGRCDPVAAADVRATQALRGDIQCAAFAGATAFGLAVLGVDASTSDVEVKKAYRRLLSQHHPDKLVSKGLPDEMMKVAAQKTHEIKQAYELIKQERGL